MLVEAIEQHHLGDVVRVENHLVKLVMIANNLCKKGALGQSGDPIFEECTDDLIEKLGIQPLSLQPIMEKLPQEMGKAVEFLNPVKQPPSE